ncbi:MAG: tetratricopeptide repeat protein [Kiritimatiellae bacterium]|nr:tetratricopeptide repeat protein [Kiritimatiellia bacterium]
MTDTPPSSPGPASRRDRELAIFGLAVSDPARAAADYDALVAEDAPWSLPVPLALASFVASRLPADEATAFLARQMPVWPMLLESLARRFDPDATGFVRWPVPADDLFPELAHPGTIAPDAAILLSNEARLYLDATTANPDLRPASDIAQAILQDTDSTLLESLWDAENQCLLCTTPDGGVATDATARGLFPLLWRSLPRADGDAISAASASAFPTGGTPAAWILLVAFLSSSPYRRVFADCCRQALPPHATPAETEAFSSLLAALAPTRKAPQPLSWMAAHPLLAAVAGILLLLGIGGAATVSFRAPAPTAASLEQCARDAAARGDPATAATLYSRAAGLSPTDAPRLAFAAANALFRAADYPAAEAAYRAILEAAPDTPSAALNLALSLLRQNRRDEALALYRKIAASPHSDAASRAALAADFLSALP